MKCKYCGEINYQSNSSRKTTSMIVLFPLLTMPINLLFDLTFRSYFLLELILILVALLLLPLFLKLTDKDEPSW